MGQSQPIRLILASGSPARRDLLKRAGYPFEVIPAQIDEPREIGPLGIRGFVNLLAWLKANAVAPAVPEGLVLAADTVGWLNGEIIGKPADQADARRILRQLGGTTHELWTGVVLWRRPDDLQLAFQEKTLVGFKTLTDQELDCYLQTRQWQGCSGAYAIQERDDPFVRVVEGSLTNVIGLPLETLARVLPTIVCPANGP